MSERERWIVYPLLFFALGAAIRDKILNVVESKQIQCAEMEGKSIHCTELDAKSIRCEAISIEDPQRPGKILAQLSWGPLPAADGREKRVGRLLLTDSEGREIFGLQDDMLQMRMVRCEGLAITDPVRPATVLAALGSVAVPVNPGEARFAGILQLNKQALVALQGLPFDAYLEQFGQPPASQGETDSQSSPAGPAESKEPQADPGV